VYRVEVYRGDKFSGMVLVRFGGAPTQLVQGSDYTGEEDTLGR